jgi:hypothetical protein
MVSVAALREPDFLFGLAPPDPVLPCVEAFSDLQRALQNQPDGIPCSVSTERSERPAQAASDAR